MSKTEFGSDIDDDWVSQDLKSIYIAQCCKHI